MAASIHTNFNTKQTCSICKDLWEREREAEVPLAISAQSRVGHPVQHLSIPKSPGCPSPALIHWHWWKRACGWLLEGSRSLYWSGQPCWGTQPSSAIDWRQGWGVGLWHALVWGALCSLYSLWHSSCDCLSSWCGSGWRNLAPWGSNDIEHLQPVFLSGTWQSKYT